MRAIILAGGQSKRLRPFTRNLPKCLLTVGNETILDRQLNALKKAGVKEFIFIVGFKKEKIITHIAKHHPDITHLEFIDSADYKVTGAGFGLSLARHRMPEGTLYLNADVVCHDQIIYDIAHHKADAVTAVQKSPWAEEQVNVIVDDNDRILEIGKHLKDEESHGEFVGVTKIGPQFAEALIKAFESYDKEEVRWYFAADAINRAIRNHGGEHVILDVTGHLAREIDEPHEYEDVARILKEA